jgi:hypothetical protein
LSFSFSFSTGTSIGLIVALDELAMLYMLVPLDMILSAKLAELILCLCSPARAPSLLGLGIAFSFVSFVLIFPGREKSFTFDVFSALEGFSGSRKLGEYSAGDKLGDVCGLL